jgi:hypothetical protein
LRSRAFSDKSSPNETVSLPGIKCLMPNVQSYNAKTLGLKKGDGSQNNDE